MTPGSFLTPSHHHRRGGFSLIEILITVGIIALLISIVAFAGMRMKDNSRISHARRLLAEVKAIDTEYEALSGGSHVNFVPANAADAQDNSIEAFVAGALKYPNTKSMLLNLKDQLVDKDGDTNAEILDPWGNKLIYLQSSGDANTNFLPPQKFHFFASAGPDGLWGSVEATASDALKAQAADNIYSYNLE